MNSLATPTPGNRTEFSDLDASEMIVEGVSGMDNFGIKFASTYREFANSDAPAVALAILKAAGFVPRGNRIDSDSFQESVDTAAGYLDDAVAIREHEDARKQALVDLLRRRDEVAQLVAKESDWPHPDAARFTDFPAETRHAIDMIIQLQDAATA